MQFFYFNLSSHFDLFIAILAAVYPDQAPFMADECMLSTPGVETMDYTVAEYLNYTMQLKKKCDYLKNLGKYLYACVFSFIFKLKQNCLICLFDFFIIYLSLLKILLYCKLSLLEPTLT